MKYAGKMDRECLALCDAINAIPGVQTTESCCGHGQYPFRVWLHVETLIGLPDMLYWIDPCHSGFRWNCYVYTDCGKCYPYFLLESVAVGEKAYEQADFIAKHMGSDGL